jgi:hypothetical protein
MLHRTSRLIRFPRFSCRAGLRRRFLCSSNKVSAQAPLSFLAGFSPVMQYIVHGALDYAAARVNSLRSLATLALAVNAPFGRSPTYCGRKAPAQGVTHMQCIKTGAQVSTGSSACQLCSCPCAAYQAATANSDQRLSQLCAAWRSRRQAAGKPLHGRWANTPTEQPQPVQGRLI